MPNKHYAPNFFLAVLALLVTAFLLSGAPVSGKSALGGSDFSLGVELEKSASNSLSALEKSFSCRWAALGICDGAEGSTTTQTTSNSTQPWKYDNRVDVTQRTAADVNAEHAVKGNQPPYKSGTQVIEYTTKQDDVFVRVHGDDNAARPWMMRKEAIEGLTAEQIQRKYSLLSKPKFVSEVHVPAGTRIRTGKVETNFEIQGGGGQGATQYEWLNTRVPPEAISNTRALD